MSGCRPSRCNFKALPGDWRIPQALVTDLQTNYSLALYGHKYLIDLSRLRVLWPALLSAAAHRSLFAPHVLQCGKNPWLNREVHLFVDPPKNNLQAAAIWVHQPKLATAARALVAPASHSWVEVSHCYYSSEASHGKIEPMWFFATPVGQHRTSNLVASQTPLLLDLTRFPRFPCGDRARASFSTWGGRRTWTRSLAEWMSASGRGCTVCW